MNSIDTLKSFKNPKSIDFSTGERSLKLQDVYDELIYTSLHCENPDPVILNGGPNWHQILIHHKNNSSKQEILDAFFEIVEDELFVPVGYRRGAEIDFFFLRNQTNAMLKIFERKLRVSTRQNSLEVMVKLGVATYFENQLSAVEKINEVIALSINSSIHLGSSQTLNLDNTADHPKMQELCFNLGNSGNLSFFMKQLNSFEKIKKHSNFRIFKFAGNNIKSLVPFTELYNFQMSIVDLSNNNIQNIEELKYLENLMVEELFVDGNQLQSIERIREVLPKLKKIDKILILTTPTLYKTNIKGEPTAIGNKMIPSSSFRDGVVIKPANRAQYIKSFNQLRNDTCWSKVIVYHNQTSFSLKQILKKFAMEICFHNQFFPCYAKRFKNRDEFYLYKNFDALKSIFSNELKVRMDKSGKNNNLIY